MGIIIPGESQQWSPWAVLEPVQRELALSRAVSAPVKVQILSVFFSSKWLP